MKRLSPAFLFVLTMGIVNLFADITYEGGTLGASAAAIGIVAGAGEFLGYAIRSVAGYVSDRTGRYWLFTFVGYAINLLAVPAMALAGGWPLAAALVLAERTGRGIRKPTVESMLSYTTDELGRGRVYALNNALDETGALLGPLAMALLLVRGGSIRTGYALLLIPGVLALLSLTGARIVFPVPSKLERRHPRGTAGFTRAYWVSMGAASLFAAGLVSFELISYHFAKSGALPKAWIPISLAIATAGGIVASLGFGRMYDRVGMPSVLIAVALSAFFSPLVFLGGFLPALAGMVLWGVGYAAQDTLFKANVAGLLPEGKRNLAFGLFYAGYGFGWLAGSIATGLLYERSLTALIAVSMGAQLASLPLFALAGRGRRRAAPSA